MQGRRDYSIRVNLCFQTDGCMQTRDSNKQILLWLFRNRFCATYLQKNSHFFQRKTEANPWPTYTLQFTTPQWGTQPHTHPWLLEVSLNSPQCLSKLIVLQQKVMLHLIAISLVSATGSMAESTCNFLMLCAIYAPTQTQDSFSEEQVFQET